MHRESTYEGPRTGAKVCSPGPAVALGQAAHPGPLHRESTYEGPVQEEQEQKCAALVQLWLWDKLFIQGVALALTPG